ncbi:hypothetical protein [Polynucleobacter sp.]|uniref:hypothetical protein n=1 Tax=Polynucleobacter sp. TaxID=2029855 RepID=UPI003F69B803
MDLSGGDCRRRDETERLEGVMFPDAYGVYRVNRQTKPPEGGFGNAFGNKSVESLQTLAIPIDLTDATSAMTAIDPKQSFA